MWSGHGDPPPCLGDDCTAEGRLINAVASIVAGIAIDEATVTMCNTYWKNVGSRASTELFLRRRDKHVSDGYTAIKIG